MQPDRSFEESGADEASRRDQGINKEAEQEDFWAPRKRANEDLSPRDWAEKPADKEPSEAQPDADRKPTEPVSRDEAVTDAQRRIQELLGTFSPPAQREEPAKTAEPWRAAAATPGATSPERKTDAPQDEPAPPSVDTSTPKIDGPGPVKIETTSPPITPVEPPGAATQTMPPPPAVPVQPPSQAAAQRYIPYTKGRVRRLSQTLNKVHPWSVLKLSLLFYISVMLVFTFAVMILYYAADASGIISNLESFIQGIGWEGWRMGAGTVLRVTLAIGLLNTIFWSAVNVLIAFLYNLVADIVGGVRITTTEREL